MEAPSPRDALPPRRAPQPTSQWPVW
jgi:hypothetical protein